MDEVGAKSGGRWCEIDGHLSLGLPIDSTLLEEFLQPHMAAEEHVAESELFFQSLAEALVPL